LYLHKEISSYSRPIGDKAQKEYGKEKETEIL
jgi:hypothetical protein